MNENISMVTYAFELVTAQAKINKQTFISAAVPNLSISQNHGSR